MCPIKDLYKMFDIEMTASLTMKSTISFILLVLLAIYAQNIECKNVDGEKLPTDKLKSYPLATRERDLRGLRDVWDQVKNNAISSWNFLKQVAEDTREKITEWSNSAKEYAVELEKTFEEQLQDLQNKLNDIIRDLLGTGKQVQECLKTEGRNIQDALKEILKKLSECISNQIKQLTHIEGRSAELYANDTLFMAELDEERDKCKADEETYEECLYTVRSLVYEDIEDLNKHIQKLSLESRSIADGIKNTLTTCSIQNIADASSYITTEIMQIVKCVLDSKGISKAILE